MLKLQASLIEKDIEILELKNRLIEEKNEKAQLQEYIQSLVSSKSSCNIDTTISFFSPPQDPFITQQLQSLKQLLNDLKQSINDSNNNNKTVSIIEIKEKEIKELQNTNNNLKNQIKEQQSNIQSQYSSFNPLKTKVIHLITSPPLSPKAAQYYSSKKSNDNAIIELQQQLNNSRKEAKRTAEVATRKCKEFRSLCCKLFGWRVDIIDSTKRNIKRCRVHSIFNEEDYLHIEVGRKNCDLTPSSFLETLNEDQVDELIKEGGIPRLLHQLYQLLYQQTK